MSGGRFLLLFLAEDLALPTGWLRLRDGAVASRGALGDRIPPLDPDAEHERLILIVPGTLVVIHSLALPPLAPLQAAAAARLAVTDVSSEPLDQLHVAIGRADAKGVHLVGVASASAMRAWLAEAAGHGFDPDHVIPESLLLALPEDGVATIACGHLSIYRGRGNAMVAEPALAALVTGDAPLHVIDDATFEIGLVDALARPDLDLRQGAFARRRRWRIDWKLVRRLAILGGLILLAILFVQLVLILRYSLDADRLERRTESIARGALPRGAGVANVPVQLTERLSDLRGGGLGFTTLAAALFAAVRDTPTVQLTALTFDPGGTLRATVSASGTADLAALQLRLSSAGYDVTSTPPRTGGGRQIIELAVRGR